MVDGGTYVSEEVIVVVWVSPCKQYWSLKCDCVTMHSAVSSIRCNPKWVTTCKILKTVYIVYIGGDTICLKKVTGFLGRRTSREGGDRVWFLWWKKKKIFTEIVKGKDLTVYQPSCVVHRKSPTEERESLQVNSKGVRKSTELSSK